MFRPKAKYRPGDLVIWNESKDFGNEKDRLFRRTALSNYKL